MPKLRTALALAGLAAISLAAAQAHAEGGERKKGGGLSFTQFHTLTAAIMRMDGRRGVLTVEAGIDTLDPALKAKTDLLGPRLRDAYTSTLITFATATAPGAPPDVDLLAARLQQATDRVVGRPGAKLLIGTVIVN